MKVRVRVHAGSKVEKTETRGDQLHVWVKVPPVDGKANIEVAALLAEQYQVARTAVRLTSGHTARLKIFEIDQS